ncbi:MAG: OstA-like protein [Chitinophagales bacterium]|nr:hypothetical protein [Chitinophagales bacterium]MDW8392693.1 OstA-like protein [Chitinophagales bacterium]
MEIVHADQLEYRSAGGVKMRRLSGQVQLRQGDATLWCQQADYFMDENRIVASGSVHIMQADTIHAYGDRLQYDGQRRQARLSGQVRLTDGHMTLHTTDLDYDLNRREAQYQNGGRVVSSESVLTSRKARYDLLSYNARFIHQVVLTHPSYTIFSDSLQLNTESRLCSFIAPTRIVSDSGFIVCSGGHYDLNRETARFTGPAEMHQNGQQLRADTIDYDRIPGLMLARGHLRWVDSSARITVTGKAGRYVEPSGLALVYGQALLSTLFEDDSLFIGSDTLLSLTHPQNQSRHLRAYYRVKVYSDNLQAVCDSLVFSDTDSLFRLYRNPVLWAESYQLSADTMLLEVVNRKIHRLLLRHNAFAVQSAGPDQYNQAKGRLLTAWFKDGRLDRMHIEGNGESIYHVYDDARQYIGINRVACGSMVMHFDSSSRVAQIFFLQEPEATLFPPAQMPAEERRLRRFDWKADRQPRSKDDLLH